MYCTRLVGNTVRKNDAKSRHLGAIAHFCRAVSSQLRHLSTIELLSSSTSSTCPHNMVNSSPLTAEIGSGVWSTPANFNGFRVLAALLHGTLVVGVSQTLRRSTEGAIGPTFTISGRVEEVLLFDRFFSDCRHVPELRRHSPFEMAIFYVLYFQPAACSTFHTCILNSH